MWRMKEQASDFSIAPNSCSGKKYIILSPLNFTLSVNTRALMPPGYHKEWHIGVRLVATKKLVAFISGVPMTLKVRKKYVRHSI